jgi:hypothetical protein
MPDPGYALTAILLVQAGSLNVLYRALLKVLLKGFLKGARLYVMRCTSILEAKVRLR